MAKATPSQLGEMWQAVAACIEEFEAEDYDPAEQADLRELAQRVPLEYRYAALEELVKADMRRSWNSDAPRQARDYLDEYHELRDENESTLSVYQQEYSLRSRHGQQPTIDEYLAEFPDFVAPEVPGSNGPAAKDTDRAQQPTLVVDPQAVSTVRLPADKQIGRFRVIGEIGAGGFGIVYHGYDPQIERHVAIKCHKAGDGAAAGLPPGLLHEARSIARLDHPNIVKLLEAGETADGLGYVVYELVEGETLRKRIRRGDYTCEQAVEWISQVAEALQYAHTQGIVHRDIKPENILLDAQLRPKIIDFGLARREDKFYLEDRGHLVGTLSYMSPEQARGESHWSTSQSDIYSLGVTLYELLCGKRPFRSDEAHELVDQIQFRPPPPPRSFNEAIPAAVEDACLRAIAKESSQRFRTAGDMASALRTALVDRSWFANTFGKVAAVLMVCVLVAVIMWSLVPSAPAVVPPPEISLSAHLRRANHGWSQRLTPEHLPLLAEDTLEFQAILDRAAYNYVLMYEQEGPARLLWPSRERLPSHSPSDRVHYPPLTDETRTFSLSDRDGASLVVVLASDTRVPESTLNRLLAIPLELNVSQDVASSATNLWAVAYPANQVQDEGQIILRSGPTSGREPMTHDLRVPETLKQALQQAADSHYGLGIAHKKTAPAEMPAAPMD